MCAARSRPLAIIALFLLAAPLGLLSWWASRPKQTAAPAKSQSAESLPKEVQSLLADFRASDWTTVYRAKDQLESQQRVVIPALLQMLDEDVAVPLTKTADLIYPGAKEFYGHGWFIDYDLDYLPARAGWALEEVSFCDFGFGEASILERRLPKSVISGRQDVTLAVVNPATLGPVRRRARIATAIAAAKQWWTKEEATWTRYGAVKQALQNNDASRQSRAIEWIRYGRTGCEGLSPESFARDLRPIVNSLANSEHEGVRNQASLLLRDDEAWWWKYKTDPELARW